MFLKALISIRGAFSRMRREEAPTPLERPQIEDVCMAYFECSTWASTRVLLDQYRRLLLDARALEILKLMREVAMDAGRLELVPVIDERRNLLVQCRRDDSLDPLQRVPPYTRREVLDWLMAGKFDRVSEAVIPLAHLKEMLHALMSSAGADTEYWDSSYAYLVAQYAKSGPIGCEACDERPSRKLRLGHLYYERANFAKQKLVDYTEAGAAYAAAIRTFSDIGHVKGLSLATYGLATVHIHSGDNLQALPMLADSVKYAAQCNFIPQLIQSRRVFGKRLSLDGRVEDARDQLLQSLELAVLAREDDEAMMSAKAVSTFAERIGDSALLRFADSAFADAASGRGDQVEQPR